MAAEPNIDKLIEALLNNPTQKNLDKVPVDESFAQTLARILKERGLKHSEVYDELGMTNVGFWKLLKGKSNPTKMTVFGLAIALKLSIEETKEMLMKAGYAINLSSLQDVIIAGLIRNKVYDRYTMDNLLYALDLQLLPGAIID
jgi:O-acetyl-ADP-ribose deacetylase